MNRIFASFLFSLIAILTSAAQGNIAVTYAVTDHDTDSAGPRSYEMTLVTDGAKSFYFNKMSLYVDSCNSTPEGKAKLREIQLKAWRVVQPDGTVTYDGRKLGLAPEKKEYLYIEKDFGGGRQTVYDYFAEGLYRYTEPIEEFVWAVSEDSTATILGYECVMAQTDYHGRSWKVWFSPEIPVCDGPWKLHGLPGMILKADSADTIHIEATEAGLTQQAVPAIYSAGDYEAGERRNLLADREHYFNNLESMLAAQGIKLNADGSSADLPKYNRDKRAWETDY